MSIQCDYCRTRIGSRDPMATVMVRDRQLHLHDTDDHRPDCADQWLDTAKDIRGERPPATTTTTP